MRCPDCDSQQPDNAATCSKCGLSFEAWREMNPIEASVQGEDMSFPESPDDPAPPSPVEEPEPKTAEKSEGSAPETSGKAEDKGSPKAKKPLPVALIGGVLGGLVLVGILAFVLMKPSASSSSVPAVVAAGSPSPVSTAPSATPTSSPTGTPTSAPAAAKHIPEAKKAPAEPTHTPTPKPQATATFTPTDIPLDDQEPGKPSGGAEAPQAPVAPVTAAPAGDLLESSGSVSTPTPATSPAGTPVP